MDHAEARELMEQAAVEPGGMDRLVTGGTVEGTRLADHIATCTSCRDELEQIRASVGTIRSAIRDAPPADLRDRTLAFVARVGRSRSLDDAGARAAVEPARGGRWSPLAWAASSAAVGIAVSAVIAVLVVGSAVGPRLEAADAAIAEQSATIAGLTMVSDWTLRLAAAADATPIRLDSSGDDAAAGTVLFSSARREMVMVASGLPLPPDGREYRCWVESGGERIPIGRMYRAGALAYWVGEVDELEGLGDDATFGVSLVDAGSQGLDGEVVLVGAS